ncbi:MAG: sigma-70 family RNA polymerase sigma factor [Acidimicrobiales bacterium]
MADDRDALITDQLGLVGAISRQLAGNFPRHVDREELILAGQIGLVEAADRYDPSLGIPFKHYAAQRIRGAMLDSVRAQDWAPRSVRAAGRRLDHAEQGLANRLSRTPSLKELADDLDITESEVSVIRYRENRAMVLTLDGVANEAAGEDLALADVLIDDTVPDPAERLESMEMQGYVRDAVALLPDRQRQVIEAYFYRNVATDELAAELGVSISRISQIKSEALEALHDGLMAQFKASRLGQDLAKRPGRSGRAETRRAEYAAAIAARRPWRERLESTHSPAPAA